MKTNFNKSVGFLLAVLILLTTLLCGCGENEKGFPAALAPLDRSAFEMCTTPYNDVKLNDIYDKAVDTGNAGDLDKSFPIQCLRKNGDQYQVIFTNYNYVLMLDYDENAKYIPKDKKESLRHLVISIANLDKLEVGDNVHKVQSIDQHSYIPFMAGVEGAPLSSDHYTEDGYHMHIEYDSDHNIVSMETTII